MASPLAIWSQLTHTIAHAQGPEEIYEAGLAALESGLHVHRASVLLFDSDGVIRFKAWRGLSDTYRAAVEGHTPWSRGTREAQPIAVPNVALDDSLAPLRPALRAERIEAMAFIPLETAEGLIGKLMLYYDTPHAFTAAELELAGLIAAQIAFAVARTRAQLAAKEGEARLRFALEAAHAGTWDWDIRRQSVRWSENVERIHGLPAGTFDGTFESYEREIHPDDRERVVSSLHRALTEGTPHDVEYRIVGPDGTVRWVEGKGRVEHGPDGRPERMTGVCMNVTPRKLAELGRLEALEQSSRAAQRLGAIVESSADAIVSKNLNGIIMSWNPGAERMFGYSASEAIGQSITIVIPPDRLAEETLVLSHVRAGEAVEMETVRRHKDGSSVWISLMVSPVKDGAGRIVGASKIARDITARKRDDAERAELHARLTTLVQAADQARRQAAFLADATAILSRSLDYEHTMSAVAQLAVPEIADWCAVDMIDGAGLLQRLAVAHADPARIENTRMVEEPYAVEPFEADVVHEVIRTGKPVMRHSAAPRPAGAHARADPPPTSSMCVPLVLAGGTLGAVTFVFAESGRRYTESDLAFAGDLAGRAALAIDNAFAYSRAHDANRLKDDFLATLSHELRTPLNAILGYAQMLNLGMLEEDARAKAITVLTRNAEGLRQIIDDVLDVSRITTGKLRLNVRPLVLEEIMKDAVATMQPAADAKGVALRVRPGSQVQPVSGDPDRLQQVVWNLLSNAVKFTPRGGHVELWLEPTDDGIQFVVSDDGMGIEPAFLPHLFERFRQGDSRISREHGGLGLGLAIVRDLVELHGGTVSAASEGPGRGATFTVRLPAAEGLGTA